MVECFNAFFGDDALNRNQAFDAVLYANVLEHVEKDADELRMVRGTLRPGGKLCVFVPAMPWLFSEFDRTIGHFRRYTRRELISRVQDAGFTVDRCIHLDSLGVVPWYVVFVLMKKTLSGGNVSLYDQCVVPWLRRIEGAIPPPFGKNLLLVATAP